VDAPAVPEPESRDRSAELEAGEPAFALAGTA